MAAYNHAFAAWNTAAGQEVLNSWWDRTGANLRSQVSRCRLRLVGGNRLEAVTSREPSVAPLHDTGEERLRRCASDLTATWGAFEPPTYVDSYARTELAE